MRGNPEEIIIGVLKDNPKKPKELLHACKAEGLKGKTYYRALHRLIKAKKIKDAKYVLIQEEEAKRSEIEDVIRRLKETKNATLLPIISEELIRLTDRKRSATIPNFLNFLESALSTPKFSEPTVLYNIIRAFHLILHYETRRYNPDEEIISRITSNISKFEKIIETYSDSHVLGEALLFLSLTESEESVDIIFKLARKLDEVTYHQIEGAFEMALFGVDSTLYDMHHVSINDRLYELIADKDQILVERGRKLHKRKMDWRR
jgi:hypothetical protein